MGPPRRSEKVALGLVAVSLGLYVMTALLGPSAAEPLLLGGWPVRRLWWTSPDWLVTVLLWGAAGCAAAGVAVGWFALTRGWMPEISRLRRWGEVGATAMALVPPLGSSDILSYGAYGRMVVLGLNPYTTTVNDLILRGDPVGISYQGSWLETPSVYGPVSLGVQGAVSWLSGTSMERFAVLLQLVALGAFVGTAVILDRSAGSQAARARVIVLWTGNPLIWLFVVNSAHLDGVAVVLGVAALVLVSRSPVGAGILAALSVGTKVSFVLYAVALVWALRRSRGPLIRLAIAGVATGAVLFTPFLPEILGPLNSASKYVARESVWSIVRASLYDIMTAETISTVLSISAWVLTGFVVWRLAKVLPHRDSGHPSSDVAIRTAAMLSVGWLLCAPYALPWYDAIAWAPLALLPASGVDLLLLARSALVTISFVPGVDRPAGLVGRATTALRGQLAPAVSLGLIVAVLFSGERLRMPRQERVRPPDLSAR